MKLEVEKLPVTGLWDSDISGVPNLEALGLLIFLHSSKNHDRDVLMKHFNITNNKYIRLLKYLEKLGYLKLDYLNNRVELVIDPKGLHK